MDWPSFATTTPSPLAPLPRWVDMGLSPLNCRNGVVFSDCVATIEVSFGATEFRPFWAEIFLLLTHLSYLGGLL
jgi:hypothetical protein